jgi:hypothetical protein
MTSLKICGRKQNSSQMSIGERAIRARIERRHPKLAHMLMLIEPGDLVGYWQALKAYDLRDPKIYLGMHRAKRLQEIWEAGVANWEMLGMAGPPQTF